MILSFMASILMMFSFIPSANSDLQGPLHTPQPNIEKSVPLDEANLAQKGPIKVNWKDLVNINYKLKYFEELETEMYAPEFNEAVTALHEKEVLITGYIIPVDPEGKQLSLSLNPYASCFFCGKASPASVISLYLKKKKKRYKIDDYKTFKGKLYLNYDNPNEFYYILKDAKEV